MASFAVNVVKRPEIECAGFKVSTSMEKASIDCPALWAKFGPVMCTVPHNDAYTDQSFGPSVMTSETAFDYWAVMPIAAGAAVPEGMEKFTLPAGEYVECEVASLKELSDAYMYVYMEWPKTQAEYGLDMSGVCYEKYTSDFMKLGKLTLYCPLKRK